MRPTVKSATRSVVFSMSKNCFNLGKYTVLDQYTFKWSDGRMALALGLGIDDFYSSQTLQTEFIDQGSLFNHSEAPNVSFTLDTSTDSIRYVTVRDIGLDEELCIFYGHNLWFDTVESPINSDTTTMTHGEAEDGWGGLLAVDEDFPAHEPFLDGDPHKIIADEDLPFTRFKIPPDEEEMDTIRTGT